MINQHSFDVTIYAPRRGYAEIFPHTPNGRKFIDTASEFKWTPLEVLQNIPPRLLVGIRTSTRKKFAQLPPTSLH